MTNIKIDGVIISQAELDRLKEQEAELERVKLSKLIIQRKETTAYSYGGSYSSTYVDYFTEEEYVKNYAALLQEAAAKSKLLDETEKLRLQLSTELTAAKFAWGWPEYLLMGAFLMSFTLLMLKIFVR